MSGRQGSCPAITPAPSSGPPWLRTWRPMRPRSLSLQKLLLRSVPIPVPYFGYTPSHPSIYSSVYIYLSIILSFYLSIHPSIHASIHFSMCISSSLYVYHLYNICRDVCIQVQTHMRIHTCMYADIHICTGCVHTCRFICVDICTHTHVPIHVLA